MSFWWQTLFVVPRKRQLSEVPATSLLGRGTKPGSLDSLHSWSLTAWSLAHHVFLLEALPQLRHSQNGQKDLVGLPPHPFYSVFFVPAFSISVYQGLIPHGSPCPRLHFCLLFLQGLVVLVLAGSWAADYTYVVFPVFHTPGALCHHLM